MKHRWWWLGFGCAVAVVVAAMSWVTLTAFGLQQAEAKSRRQSFREESARLALWRMDSLLTPLIAREAARPYLAYNAFFPAERAYDRTFGAFGAITQGEVIIPSPLLGLNADEVRLHVQVAPDGSMTSPQVPMGTLRILAVQSGVTETSIGERERQLAGFAGRMSQSILRAALDRSPTPLVDLTMGRANVACQIPSNGMIVAGQAKAVADTVAANVQLQQLQSQQQQEFLPAQQVPPAQMLSSPTEQRQRSPPTNSSFSSGSLSSLGSRSNKELQARNQTYRDNTSKAQVDANGNDVQIAQTAEKFSYAALLNRGPELPASKESKDSKNGDTKASKPAEAKKSTEVKAIAVEAPRASSVRAEIMRPLWLGEGQGEELVLARRVSVDGDDYLQVCWLDWPLIRQQLLTAVADILPGAEVVAVGAMPIQSVHRLATLPVALIPGNDLSDYVDAKDSPIIATLVVAWLAVALATLAGAASVAGTLRLSERRGAFVSAVTHELRTPLTTFRLYADLLAGDMVPDAKERQRCLDTLRVEADRLAHLVENVLAYAQLERAKAPPVEPIVVGELLDAVRERLSDRARQAGLELTEDHATEARALRVRADAQGVERVLFNLVDNACKYAAGGATLTLRAWPDGDHLALAVRDHGPGVPDDVRRRLFTPFAKSSEEAARSAPGVGLGLALSRRLARQLGGDLVLETPTDGGACFVLRLPLTNPDTSPTHS